MILKIKYMEVVTIEKKTFEELTREVNEVISMAEGLLKKFKPARTEWLDHENVCMILSISKRTLQNYKDQKLIPYTRISRKSYFKFSDIENFLNNKKRCNDGAND